MHRARLPVVVIAATFCSDGVGRHRRTQGGGNGYEQTEVEYEPAAGNPREPRSYPEHFMDRLSQLGKENAMSGTEGKVVVITGASSGIGEASALLLAERGAKAYSAPADQIALRLWPTVSWEPAAR